GFGKNGAIIVNKTAVELLKVKAGDKVEISQDEEEPKNWYISATNEESGFVLRERKDDSLTFNSSSVCKDIMQSFDLEGGVSFRVASETEPGSTWHGLLKC